MPFPITHFLRAFLCCACCAAFLSCASAPARQSAEEWEILKTPLIEGEVLLRANSCSRMSMASIFGGMNAKFGSCFLTNLRFIYEDSAWFKALETASKLVPTGQDFGIMAMSRTAQAFNANYVVQMGKDGKLQAVEKDGRIIIPLSEMQELVLTKKRWLTIQTRGLQQFVFEIYDLPPDKTGILPTQIASLWKDEIETAYHRSFGASEE